MANVSQWTPFGVALDLTATVNTITRTSSTAYTVKFNVSWETHWDTKTDYGMTASSGGGSVSLNSSGTKAASGSGTFTGTYSTSANVAATKTVTVTFRNYNTDHDDSATKNISLSVSVPAWTSYKVSYNANGGSGAPSAQTKWKNQTLTLSSTKPTRAGYTFAGWATSSSGSVAYAAGASYTSNASVTLYAKWTANTYTVSYNANGGSGAPSSQTKTYGVSLTLSSTRPTRANYNFVGWGTSAGATTPSYQPGGSYTSNASITLYAIWSLAYTKPRISSFSVTRCDSSGVVTDSGTYALVRLNWACDKTISSIVISWKRSTESSYYGNISASASGTSGTVSQVVGSGGFSTENTWNIRVVVSDTDGNSDVTGTVQAIKYPIDIKNGGTGIAFGKPAETADLCECNYNMQANRKLTVGKYVDNATAPTGGMKIHDLREVTPTPGMFGDNVMNLYFDSVDVDGGYWKTIMDLTGWTAGSYATHQLAFNAHNNVSRPGLWHRTGINGVWEAWRQLLDSMGGSIEGALTFANNAKINGTRTDGSVYEIINPMSPNNNMAIGNGLYANKSGNLNLYGHDIQHYISNIASPGSYRPYRRRGDVLNVTMRTAGYVTNSGKDVSFFIPFSVPIVGSPTVTVASGNGFTLRQGNVYTHGSTASSFVTPDSYSVSRQMWHGIMITAVFSTTTNVTNNDAIGIYWDGTITLS